MLDKTYDPAASEAKWSRHWEETGAYECGRRPDAEPYAIVMPPPNVTGSLHMGHALDVTLQDVLIRFERLRGKDVLWQPGTDHAGIATQMVVERQLDAEGLDRRALGREAFLEKVWEWKAKSGGTITAQLRRLGASCDWSREAFTMDAPRSRAVIRKFVTLYRDGLIYRDRRLVNWDPKLKTAISDLEVEQKEVDGSFWYFRYPVEGGNGRHIVIATTRPETMLGDTAVAVHPEDDRYRDLIGKHVRLPLSGRLIPIVADDYADPEQGTGAVKITPAHDFNDFEVGRRHGLPAINIFDADARLNENVPEGYRGMERFAAREKVVADLEALGLVEKVEPKKIMQPFGDRSGTVIEPWLTEQWYVDAAKLAGPAIEAVETGRTRFIPKNWEKTYYEWMRNIQPWCISRQLWWGHRIPAWYAPDGAVFVAETEEEAQAQAGAGVPLRQDEDVLDTWFSSAMWPYSTLGWPEDAPELARYYPNATLVTGFDIIFFWVARMMMSGLYFMGEVPFKDVYIHALVRDEKGQKMSKSKGNAANPLVFIDAYGADALRFTLAAMEAQGRDIKLSESRIQGYRNFGTKLWNAARFTVMNGCTGGASFNPAGAEQTVNRWIVAEVKEAAEAVTAALEAFRFNEAADAVYRFVWGTFCDWYLELTKPVLTGGSEAEKTETQACVSWVLDQILILLHPFMPFITEELWHRLDAGRASDLILAAWPDHAVWPEDKAAVAEMRSVIQLISEIRSARAEMNVPPSAKIAARVSGASPETLRVLAANSESIGRLSRLESLTPADAVARAGTVQVVVNEATVLLPLAGVIDLAAEKARLEKNLAAAGKERDALAGRLENANFVAKAPPAVIEEARARLAELTEVASKIKTALERLG